MNYSVLKAALYPLAALALHAQSLDLELDPPSHPLPGSYRPAACDTELVQAARECIQKQLPGLLLAEVTEAYTQVVAGLNVKLVCMVMEPNGPAIWQFVAFRSLDHRWQLTSAKRLGPPS